MRGTVPSSLPSILLSPFLPFKLDQILIRENVFGLGVDSPSQGWLVFAEAQVMEMLLCLSSSHPQGQLSEQTQSPSYVQSAL